MSTAVVLPFDAYASEPNPEALRVAIEAAGSSIARMQAAMDAKADLAGPAADLAACQFKLKTALGRPVQ